MFFKNPPETGPFPHEKRTKSMEMDKKYDPERVEQKWYDWWEEKRLFHTEADTRKKPFTIVIPPPNVTGVLHMGHGLNNTIQDILIRWRRMQGYNALWLPGTDHAGIATQNVVERQLAVEGKTRQEIGRDRFIDLVWRWREEYGGRIITQLKKLGASCDWERERFTMDEGLSRAVREVFVRLYDEGLIYRGEYIINWCPRCQTALSDEEVSYETHDGFLYHIRYPLKNSNDTLVIATTRPETILGDTGVAVNPDDPRYEAYIGKTVVLPLTEREIPVIADRYVDPEFGTGALKVTPAHDPNDFEIGERHGLERIGIFSEDATINENGPPEYAGMDRYECREVLLEDLKERGLFVKQEPYTHEVGHCYRCHTTVEPYLSEQWFVHMKPLAEPAIQAVREGRIRFIPDRWEKVYMNWMTGIRDWCISRQIWWGHRIPVYYCHECGETFASVDEPSSCRTCGSSRIDQDDDVLDTWFSSQLWPFSTLGWMGEESLSDSSNEPRSGSGEPQSGSPYDSPETVTEYNNAVPAEESSRDRLNDKSCRSRSNLSDLDYFYPTSVLVTDPGILFFWVARMIMSGLRFMHDIPFSDVYIHGVVMDEKGRKMSKSLGNGIDPLEVVEKYGADAMRYTIVNITPLGQNLLLSMNKFETGARFANKIWNASRYILMNIEEIAIKSSTDREALDEARLDTADRWIITRYEQTVRQMNRYLEEFKLMEASSLIYEFFWHEFCDWYIEISKVRLYSDDGGERAHTAGMLLTILEGSLRLLHPIMPFITEEIWQRLPWQLLSRQRLPWQLLSRRSENGPRPISIMVSDYPEYEGERVSEKSVERIDLLKELVYNIRNIRGELNVPQELKARVLVKTVSEAVKVVIEEQNDVILFLARLEAVEYGPDIIKPPSSAAAVGNGYEVYLPLRGLIDVEKEKNRLNKELDRLDFEIKRSTAKLDNREFVNKAPEEVVRREQERIDAHRKARERVKDILDSLQ
jgi:valyl-tRNA synthetase